MQPGQQLIAAEAPQLEDQERIAVVLLAQEVIHRGDVLARIGVIGAGAVGFQVP